MNTKVYIYWLAALFLAITLIKYAFVPTVFSPVYYTFEILGLFIVLGITYMISASFMLKKNCKNEELNQSIAQLENENNKLTSRITALQKSAQEEKQFTDLKDEIVDVFKSLVGNNTKTSSNIFSVIKKRFEVVAGIVYVSNGNKDGFSPVKRYGVDDEWEIANIIAGEGVHGQSIVEKKAIEISDIPEDYLQASSGSGEAQPAYIYILPFITGNNNDFIIEVSSFKAIGLDEIWNTFIDHLTQQN